MDSQQEPYMAYAESIFLGLIDNKDALKIEKTTDDRGVLLTVSVGKEDMGKIIGKQGSTIQSIRRLVAVSGALCNAGVSIRLTEPDGSIRRTNKESYQGN